MSKTAAVAAQRSDEPFRTALRGVLEQQQSGIRDLGRRLGLDPTFLSRVTKSERPLPADLPERVAVALGLPADYFPETRLERVRQALESDVSLLDRIFDQLGLGRVGDERSKKM